MIVKIPPVPFLKGRVVLPASKSYSIRAFIVAACGGVSSLVRPSDCDDALVSLNVARQLGAKISTPTKDRWSVRAAPGLGRVGRFHVGESGTVLRFLLPLLALRGRPAFVDGKGTLRGRPNAQLLTALRACGVDVRGTGPKEGVPIRLAGGRLTSGRIQIDGSLSSQFISALLIACPLLPERTIVQVTGKKVVSGDYIAMTLKVLSRAGIRVRQISAREFSVPGAQRYKGLRTFEVPSDYGLAAFLMAAGALVPSELDLCGCLDERLPQADGRIMGFLKRMGVRYSGGRPGIRMRGPFTLTGGDFSLKDCPDLVPIMSVLALFAKGTTRLTDIGHARVKESDRISDLRAELLKVGADVRETRNTLTIVPRPFYRAGVQLDPHRDHRLAMAFCVLGLRTGVKVKDIECVSKSYPNFLRDLRRLGVPAGVI